MNCVTSVGVNPTMSMEAFYSEFETMTARDDANEVYDEDLESVGTAVNDLLATLQSRNETVDLTLEEVTEELDTL
ncbi:hypothetical protein BLNAU_24450 [Blattamonas nauphoetae]|uniref:Uncharacterized protein n=1 Tax=Blattamonas nauphoetae TaxID=2049346 RepID=A0ABQ9WMD7_9EUKA|nr:hypothetical protein BLNAU_24450 [Blattamonas nauphoetae]